MRNSIRLFSIRVVPQFHQFLQKIAWNQMQWAQILYGWLNLDEAHEKQLRSSFLIYFERLQRGAETCLFRLLLHTAARPKLDSKLPLRLFILQSLPSELCSFLEALCGPSVDVHKALGVGHCKEGAIVIILEISLNVSCITIEACVSTAIFKRRPCLTSDFTRIWSIIVKRSLQK